MADWHGHCSLTAASCGVHSSIMRSSGEVLKRAERWSIGPHCRSTAKIPLTVIYEEIVSKAIHKIKNLRRRQKLGSAPLDTEEKGRPYKKEMGGKGKAENRWLTAERLRRIYPRAIANRCAGREQGYVIAGHVQVYQ